MKRVRFALAIVIAVGLLGFTARGAGAASPVLTKPSSETLAQLLLPAVGEYPVGFQNAHDAASPITFWHHPGEFGLVQYLVGWDQHNIDLAGRTHLLGGDYTLVEGTHIPGTCPTGHAYVRFADMLFKRSSDARSFVQQTNGWGEALPGDVALPEQRISGLGSGVARYIQVQSKGEVDPTVVTTLGELVFYRGRVVFTIDMVNADLGEMLRMGQAADARALKLLGPETVAAAGSHGLLARFAFLRAS